jgi:ATP-binding cassette subfamily F protein 3
MILLTIRDVTKRFGPDPVLDGVTFDVRAGERIALVGPNGTGKTTLLKILAGRDDPDGGTVERPGTATLGFLEQQPDFVPGRSVWDEAHDALRDLSSLTHESERVAQAIAESDDDVERTRLGERFDHLQQELQHRDAYNLDHKVERILTGLGFAPAAFQQAVDSLSGGQQNRLLLAKLLLEEPDLLLLDEPSNHLDLEATEWLEQFLIQTNQALLVVSHDRYFLDKVADRTLELFQGTVDSYPGNYSAYQRQKAERLEVQRRTFEKQQTEIAKMEQFVRKHSYGQKHAQAEDRRKKLERIELVAVPREIVAPPMGFPPASRTGDVVVRAEHLAKAYDQTLFDDLTFDIQRGERWGIMGPNGSGKTTLLRCLLGETEPDAGRVILGTGVRMGYFDQLLGCLEDDALVVDAIRPDHKEFVEQQRRDLLARFGIRGDMVFQTVRSLSGGERNRVALAMLAASDANLLVLDEPTNHLDLWAREALEKAVNRFDGTVPFVSHDRYFLNRVADHLLIVEPHRFRVIEGNYETYLYLAKQGLAAGERWTVESPGAAPAEPKKSSPSEAKSGRRKRKFAYRKSADIEAEIAEREARIEQLHADLADPQVLRDGNRVKEVKAELDAQQAALPALYEHWEEAAEMNG